MSDGTSLNFRLGDDAITVEVDDLVIAGWTGRDAAAIEAHIEELAAIGIPRPSTVPLFYRVAADTLTTAGRIQVPGAESSGEVEFVLFGHADGMLIAAGSDHTERKVESYSITVSKQMCAKPVSPEVWRFADVADHFDRLMLRGWATDGGEKRLYQEGGVTAMRPPGELIGLYLDGADALPPGMAMFCGTLAVHGGVKAAERFDFELEDPVLGRTLRHGYDVAPLPIVT
jgi:hypothetical protein